MILNSDKSKSYYKCGTQPKVTTAPTTTKVEIKCDTDAGCSVYKWTDEEVYYAKCLIIEGDKYYECGTNPSATGTNAPTTTNAVELNGVDGEKCTDHYHVLEMFKQIIEKQNICFTVNRIVKMLEADCEGEIQVSHSNEFFRHDCGKQGCDDSKSWVYHCHDHRFRCFVPVY